jgi:hemerythrin-like domain-containing protein
MTQGLSVAQVARRAAVEHDKLRHLLAQVEAAFGRSEPRAGSGPDVVAARLDSLRGPLRAHFEDEERNGFLERLQEPGTEQELLTGSLRAEHQELIQDLDSLRFASPLERRGPMWLRDVRRFLDALAGHESREAALLDQADARR